MSDKDPFAEPDDTDKTVIRPNPGGRRQAGGAPQQPAGLRNRRGPDPMQIPQPSLAQACCTGWCRLRRAPGTAPAIAARAGRRRRSGDHGHEPAEWPVPAPLFSLISRIRNRAQHMDPDKLRQSVVSEVRSFENAALQAGIAAQTVKVARYALCATLDDVVLNTPWGGQSSWGLQSMVGTFHRETVGGDRFYDLLARLEKDPANNIDMLEFVYMCLSLGFEGRLRVEQGGPDKHLQIRQGLARIIRGQRGRWNATCPRIGKGSTNPIKARSACAKPVWIAVGVTAILLADDRVWRAVLPAVQQDRKSGDRADVGDRCRPGGRVAAPRTASSTSAAPQAQPQVEKGGGRLPAARDRRRAGRGF